jgi:hypothetical protein
MEAGPSPSGCTTNSRAWNARSVARWPTLKKIFCSGVMYDNVPRHAWSPPNFPHSEDEAIIQHYRHLGGESTAGANQAQVKATISHRIERLSVQDLSLAYSVFACFKT